MSLYLYTESVDDFHKKATAAGAQSLSSPEDMFWGDRMCVVEDLDGLHWAFATHLGQTAHHQNKTTTKA